MASPELEVLVDALRANPPVQGADVEAMRAGMRAASRALPLPQDVGYEPVDAVGVSAEWTRAPNAAADRVVLYLHGGGYVMGSVETHRLLVADLSRAAAVRILSLDYRLGPEHPHPAAVDDAVCAYRFLLGQGVAADRIAIAGDSAGGGLTVAALLALSEAGDPLPAAGICISPWLDLTLSGASMDTKADVDPMVSRDVLQQMADAYLAGAEPTAPTASPLFGDLTGLPPLLIQVGTAETLLDDSRRLAERAKSVDVAQCGHFLVGTGICLFGRHVADRADDPTVRDAGCTQRLATFRQSYIPANLLCQTEIRDMRVFLIVQ